MSFLFGSAAKETFSTETIKRRVETYHRIVNEFVDYIHGDYVVLKSEANDLGLSKNEPHICYILEVDNNVVTAAYVKGGQLCIDRITRFLYKKATIEHKHPDDLEQFVKDVSVKKYIEPGTLVRSRLHCHIFNFDLSSSSMGHKVLEPVVVMENKAGKITIAGCAEYDGRIITRTVNWYELALYH